VKPADRPPACPLSAFRRLKLASGGAVGVQLARESLQRRGLHGVGASGCCTKRAWCCRASARPLADGAAPRVGEGPPSDSRRARLAWEQAAMASAHCRLPTASAGATVARRSVACTQKEVGAVEAPQPTRPNAGPIRQQRDRVRRPWRSTCRLMRDILRAHPRR
jgi:hypothetical protein